MAKSFHTIVAIQLPNESEADVRALGQAVASRTIAGVVVGIDTDGAKRIAHVRFAVMAPDQASLSIRAAELVRTLLDRFYTHRQQFTAMSA